MLSSAQHPIPYTYGQILSELETLPDFVALSGRLQTLAALRNLMAHEYLDLRFGRIMRLVAEDAVAVGELARLTRTWISAAEESSGTEQAGTQ